MAAMKQLLAGWAFFLFVVPAAAEYRAVLLVAGVDRGGKATVSIYSDEKKERRTAAGIDEAVKVVSGMEGWGSSVGVHVSARGLPREARRKLLGAIKGNHWLTLKHFGPDVPKTIADYYLKKGRAEPARDPARR